MTRLIVYSAAEAKEVRLDTTDVSVIARELAAVGVRFERWRAEHPLPAGASPEQILSAFAPEIDRLKSERGYASADVVSIKPGDPNWPKLRQKFLVEHTHDEDEVRYFVEGSGAFYLHVQDCVLEVIGTSGDLLSVPRGTAHWFDGGEVGEFTVIRLFTSQEGWTAHYTSDRIADAFPRYEKAA